MTESRTAAQTTADLDAAKLAREGATGQIKANMTRQIKKLEQELAAAQPDQPKPEKTKLADLERQIVATLRERGVTEPDTDTIAAIGDPVVEAGNLDGFTAARYGQGRWVSAAVLKRIRKALGAEPVAA
jgi:hypothetical protein